MDGARGYDAPYRQTSRERRELRPRYRVGFRPFSNSPANRFSAGISLLAIGREITDLVAPQNGEPPVTMDVSLSDTRFAQIHRAQPTLAIHRKSVELYNGRLFARGDTVPFNTAASASSPTAHRCCVKLVRTIASQLPWSIRAFDISQAFLQSPNLNQHR